MNAHDISNTLATLLDELVHGAAPTGGYVLNAGDEGLLRSLDKLSAAHASRRTTTGSSIAAHVDHVRYGLTLMNLWSQGEQPFESADWSISWRKTTVADAEWQQLRRDIRTEAERWLNTVRQPRELAEVELNGMIGSIAHLAYHLGAIRQINQNTIGPKQQKSP